MNIRPKAGLQADFYLCLARAFLPPLEPAACDAIRQYLAEDLAELNDALDYPIVEQLAHLQHELAAIPSHDALLAAYGALFMDPGSRVPVNTGIYFDGTLMGNTVAHMEECYTSSGMEKADGFRDLADHVAVQLEFVACLYARDAERGGEPGVFGMRAEDFLHVFVAAWAPRFAAEIAQAQHMLGLAANPYLPLARMIEIAAETDAAAASACTTARQPTAIEKARRKRAASGIGDGDMQMIEAKLRERGLATDHLRIPVEARDDAMGMTRATPPEPRRSMQSRCAAATSDMKQAQ